MSRPGRRDDADGVVQLTSSDLRAGDLPAGKVDLWCGGAVHGADLTGWRVAWLRFAEGGSLLREVLPRPLKPGRTGRDIPLFVDCDFSGLTCRAFDPGIARFIRCRFDDVDVKLNLGTAQAHFEDCTFSGRWEGNFDARPSHRDPARRVVVSGNDFTGCRGFGLQGGVDRGANTLDPTHYLVLWRGDPAWESFREIAATDDYLHDLARSIEGRGPRYLGQDWAVLDRELFSDDVWSRLLEVAAG